MYSILSAMMALPAGTSPVTSLHAGAPHVRAPHVRALPLGRLSDADLVVRARGGDRWATEAIYRRYVHYIGGLSSRLLGNRTEAEDVVQDTFILAIERLDSLRDPGSLRPWLAQISVSLVRRRYRRRKMLRPLGLDRTERDAPLDAMVAPGTDPEVRSELAALDRLLQTLPQENCIAWMLRFVEGESLSEVAEACGCSLATVKRRIAAADIEIRSKIQLEPCSTVDPPRPERAAAKGVVR